MVGAPVTCLFHLAEDGGVGAEDVLVGWDGLLGSVPGVSRVCLRLVDGSDALDGVGLRSKQRHRRIRRMLLL